MNVSVTHTKKDACIAYWLLMVAQRYHLALYMMPHNFHSTRGGELLHLASGNLDHCIKRSIAGGLFGMRVEHAVPSLLHLYTTIDIHYSHFNSEDCKG